MQCPKCGELNEPERAECWNCATKLDPEPEPPSARCLDPDLRPLGKQAQGRPGEQEEAEELEPVRPRVESIPGAIHIRAEAQEKRRPQRSRRAQLFINSVLYGGIIGAIMIGLLAAAETAIAGKIIPRALWLLLIPQIPPDTGPGIGLLIGLVAGAISGVVIGLLVALGGDGVDTGWKAGLAMAGGAQLVFMVVSQDFGQVALLQLLVAGIKGAIYGGVLGWLIEQSVER